MKLALWGPHTHSCWSRSGQWFRDPGCWGEERDFDSVSCWEERLETLGMVSYLQRILPPLQPSSSSPACTLISSGLRCLTQCTIAHLSSFYRGQWSVGATGHVPQLVPRGIVLNPMLTSPQKRTIREFCQHTRKIAILSENILASWQSGCLYSTLDMTASQWLVRDPLYKFAKCLKKHPKKKHHASKHKALLSLAWKYVFCDRTFSPGDTYTNMAYYKHGHVWPLIDPSLACRGS